MMRALLKRLPLILIKILGMLAWRLARLSWAAIMLVVRWTRPRKEIDSFLVKLKRFNDFPVMIHVQRDGKARLEFLPGFHPDEKIVAEVDRILKSEEGE